MWWWLCFCESRVVSHLCVWKNRTYLTRGFRIYLPCPNIPICHEAYHTSIWCVCVCVHAICMCHGHLYAWILLCGHMVMWSPKVDARCLPWLFVALVMESHAWVISHHELSWPQSSPNSYSNWPACFRNSLALLAGWTMQLALTCSWLFMGF